MFVLEQKGYKEEKGNIQFYFQNEESLQFVNKAIDLLKETKMIKSHVVLESDNSAKFQLLCV
jgi:hypothetical protein